MGAWKSLLAGAAVFAALTAHAHTISAKWKLHGGGLLQSGCDAPKG